MTRSLVATLAAVALLATACGGIALDEDPVGISEDIVPAELTEQPASTPTTLAPDVTATPADLYLVLSGEGEDILVPCSVPTPAGLSPEQRARAVLERLVEAETGEGEDCPGDLTNAVPPTLELFSLRLVAEQVGDTAGNTLELNFSKLPLSDIEASQQRRAIAQIVFTATGVAGVSAVRFYADGESTGVPVGDRTAEAGATLTRGDFPQLDESLEALGELLRTIPDLEDDASDAPDGEAPPIP